MPQFLVDTDHLSLYDYGHQLIVQRFQAQLGGAIAVAAVTVEEVLKGRLGGLARATDGTRRIQQYGLLLRSFQTLARFGHVAFDQPSEDQFQLLIAQRLRVGTQDLRIAATALASNLILLTRNRRDFGRVPGLQIDDWSV
jgi:tRNA(fMet)-specific endonuclease VapC